MFFFFTIDLVDTATRSKAPVEARREPTHTVG